MKACGASSVARWQEFLLAASLFFATAVTAAPTAQSQAGYAVFDPPDARRPFVSGAVNALARTPDGLLFVGSNRLAVFDGHTWRRIEVPGTSRFISLAAEPAGTSALRVWFGADGALGYVERSRTGEWLLTSLAGPLIAAGITDLSDIRHVQPNGKGGAIFVTRSHVLRWDGREFASWSLPNPPRLFVFEYQGIVHVHRDGIGVLRVTERGPEVWLKESELPEPHPLTALVELPDGDALALFFNDEAYRRHADGKWTRLPDLAPVLRSRRPLRATRVDPHTIAIGLAYGGVVLCRNDGSIIRLLNTQSGLPDDNTDSLLSEGDGKLWIGTGTGITRLVGAGHASLFDQRARIANGYIRQVLEHRGLPFVITSRRAYELVPSPPTEPASFNRIEKIWPQLRGAVVHQGQLWLHGTGGLWRTENGEAIHEPAVEHDVFLVVTPRWFPEGLVYFDRTTAYRLRPTQAGKWRSIPLGVHFGSIPTSAVEDRAGNLWVATRDGHIHAFAWDAAEQRMQEKAHHAPGSNGLPSDTQRPLLSRLGSAIVAFTENNTFVITEPTGAFTALPAMAAFTVEAAVENTDGTAWWSVQTRQRGGGPHALVRVRRDDATGDFHWQPVEAPGLDHIADVTSLSITGDGITEALWVGGENALLRIDTVALDAPPPVPPVQVLRVTLDSSHSVALPDPGAAASTFPARTSRVEFAFAARADDPSLHFQTRLAGVEANWSQPHTTAQREFTGLAPGRYDFEIRAIDRFGRTGPTTRYTFVLDAPWYRRTPAMLLWALLILLAIRGATKARVRSLKRQAARLEQLVNERTRELSLSNTARSEFLDSLNHELRRPLNGIASLTKQLEESKLTPEQREQTQLLRQGAESLARVCDEVLNFSAMDYGAVALEEHPFQIEEVIAAAVAEGALQSHPPSIHIAPEAAGTFVGDAVKLRIVVANFVANAIRHAAGAPVEIAVSSNEAGDGIVQLLIEVADGGAGIPVEEQELIFKRFVRGSLAKQARVPGTGIGLATCRTMARLMGGSVGVESPSERARAHGWPGPGSTFFVRVPLRRPAPVQTDAGPSGIRVKPFSIA